MLPPTIVRIVGVAGYLGLFSGVVLASAVFRVESEALVGHIGLLAFWGLLVSLFAARAHDRVVVLSSGLGRGAR